MRNYEKYQLIVCFVVLLMSPEMTLAKEKIEFQQSIKGQNLTSPVEVSAEEGIVVIEGNTFVSNTPIVEKDRQEPAAMLDIRPQQGGGRIIISKNRFISRAPIVHREGGVSAMSVVTRPKVTGPLHIISSKNYYKSKTRLISRK